MEGGWVGRAPWAHPLDPIQFYQYAIDIFSTNFNRSLYSVIHIQGIHKVLNTFKIFIFHKPH